MKASRSLGVVACVCLALACGRAPTVQGRRIGSGTISVEQFVVDDRTRIEGYDAPTEALASRLATAVAEALQERGKSASSGPAGSPATADVLVTGRVTEIDGGSRAKRAILGMGAGHAEFSVEGEVVRSDGTVMGRFQDSRGSVGSIGIGGGSNESVIDKCIQAVAEDIADMVVSGTYRGTPTGEALGSPAPPAPASQPADRLRALDELKAKGLVTEKEYQEQRRRILNEM
jgi:hypothetical protein